MTTGINIAIAGAIVLMLVLLGVRRMKVAAPPVSPARPIDPSPPEPARPVINLSGVTLTGSSLAPLEIRKANIVESDFTGLLKSGTMVQLTERSDAIPIGCIGASHQNLGQCKGPSGNYCPQAACQ
jgi:hypothetical protein